MEYNTVENYKIQLEYYAQTFCLLRLNKRNMTSEADTQARASM